MGNCVLSDTTPCHLSETESVHVERRSMRKAPTSVNVVGRLEEVGGIDLTKAKSRGKQLDICFISCGCLQSCT